MGCNCKGKKPLGTSTSTSKPTSSSSSTPTRPWYSPKAYTVTSGNGSTQTFGSELEARASIRRQGGTLS